MASHTKRRAGGGEEALDIAVAQFTTEDEVQAWLKDLPEPLSPVRVLVGDEYFRVWSARQGERYFAVHHKLLGIHSLHPVAAALMKWEAMKPGR